MNRRYLIAVALVAASLVASPVVFASPIVGVSSLHAMFGRGKTDKVKEVRLTLNNGSSTDRQVLAGDKALTIAAGTSVTLELPVGTRITTNDEAKSLILEVASRYSGTTVTLK
ncbi:hypothetical protein GCM10011507_18300 [Edaphobacter acidisoli]|uniref:Copper-binding protein n=1 Tax=Edaphobacter acidisoli TaxID=2040573 RepID=A0A916W4J1_9BACT|nr:hypothetical protein [Edaphobacter acidisoli]GGA67114.1 hypothetical protein GCM10011507_18300 [Edaphobacter acidisoli]